MTRNRMYRPQDAVNAERDIALMDLLLEEHGKTWPQLIDESGVDFLAAARVIREGRVNDPQFACLISDLLKPLGLTPSQSHALRRDMQRTRGSVLKRRRQIELVVRQFIVKYQPPLSHRKPLIDYCKGLAGSISKSSVAMAARHSPPFKIMDVAHIYTSLSRAKFFGRGGEA